jgi:hypothetical protein
MTIILGIIKLSAPKIRRQAIEAITPRYELKCFLEALH